MFSIRFFLTGAAVFLFGIHAAFADDAGSIIIKNKDGTVTTYEIPEGQPVVAPAPPVRDDVPAVETVVEEAPAVAEAPVVVPVSKKAVRPAVRKPVREFVVQVPLPARKPLLPVEVKEVAAALPEGYAIPRNTAIAVAIRYVSTPARDFSVYRRVYNDIPVYAVVFRAEDGEETVMVDARDGKVVTGN